MLKTVAGGGESVSLGSGGIEGYDMGTRRGGQDQDGMRRYRKIGRKQEVVNGTTNNPTTLCQSSQESSVLFLELRKKSLIQQGKSLRYL